MPDMYSQKLKNLVEITALVTESTDFFKIKDIVVSKMLEVVHPTKACLNLFYNKDYDYAYLVCSSTLKYVPTVFTEDDKTDIGYKVDFNIYPDYIHDAVKNKKVIYVENIKEDERAEKELEMAEFEGYKGRIVFPFVLNGSTIGFMTCYLTEDDYITESDKYFIKQVVSLLSLSIEATIDNHRTQNLVSKLRQSLRSVNAATLNLYQSKNINSYLDEVCIQLCRVTGSKESAIVIYKRNDRGEYEYKKFSYYDKDGEINNIHQIVDLVFASKEKEGLFNENDVDKNIECMKNVNTFAYTKNEVNGQLAMIICANSENYIKDDINALQIFLKQLFVGLDLFEYSENNIKHEVLRNEMKIINEQQRLIMNRSNAALKGDKDLFYYHSPARVIGGDVYLAETNKKGDVKFMVADVMGHGIIANYIVALMKGGFKVLANQSDSPKYIMENMNRFLYEEFDKMGVFATCIMGYYNIDTHKLTISNAGHYLPILVDNSFEISDVEIDNRGIPIGIMDDSKYDETVIEAADYSLIAMFTDGIIELKNKNNEEFGKERFEEFLKNNCMKDKKEFIESFKESISSFAGEEDFNDDILLVVLKNSN